MGLEDYRVILKLKPRKSLFPDDSPGSGKRAHPRTATAAEVAAELERLGFVRLPAQIEAGPARLAAPPDNEIRLTARQALGHGGGDSDASPEYIVEALIRGRDRSASGALLFDTLSVRFAVCQPEGAAWSFLRLVKRICEALSLEVVAGEKTYSAEVFWAFRLRANEQIRNQQALWQQIFDGEGECEPIAVDETWGRFLKRYPGLLASNEATMAPRKSAATEEVEADMEATIAPKVAAKVPVRRASRS